MKITWLMIIAAIALFVYSVFFTDTAAFFDAYGFSLGNLLARPYVLVTSVFLHASLVHLLSNILVWVFFGLAVESELGKARMLAIFFLGAFAGDLMSLAFYQADTISIGASAGIFALVGTGMLVRPLDLSFFPLVVPLPLAFLGVAYALYNVYGFQFNYRPTSLLYRAFWRPCCRPAVRVPARRREEGIEDNSGSAWHHCIDTGNLVPSREVGA